MTWGEIMSVTKNKNRTSKTINIQISARGIADAFMDLIFFHKKVDHVKISIKRFGDVPGENVSITCSGRGSLKGNVIDGTFHGIIRGTPAQVKAWQRFFDKFVEVPRFNLHEYIEWLHNNNNSKANNSKSI